MTHCVIKNSRCGRGALPPPALAGRALLALALVLPLPAIPSAQAGVSIMSQVEDAHEEIIENGLEAYLENSLQDDIEESIEDEVEEGLVESLEESIENDVEEQVAESLEEAVEDTIEGRVEESIADITEDRLEERIAETVEETVEQLIADTVEESIEEGIATAVEESIAEAVEGSIVEAVEESVANVVEESVGDVADLYVEESVEDNILDSVIDSTEARLEAYMDKPERHLSKHEWLVMAEEGALEVLARNGYVFDRVTRLEGLDLQLAEVSAPASFDISEVRAGILDVIGGGLAEVDINHLYTAGVPAPSSEAGMSPREAMSFPADTAVIFPRIGMIDTAVDTGHAAFADSHVRSRHFGDGNGEAPDFHGTAIASMLSAHSDEYRGIAPETRLFAASVFERDRELGKVASTASLVKALDWLAREKVEVVNISLAGPPNRLLEAVLNRITKRGIPVIAAAGNAGPTSEPLYPAAYDSVVAVTAVEPGGKVFRLANRGKHLDLSAPGVNIRHAKAGGGYNVSSGTSFAVPFATVAVARLRAREPETDALSSLYRSAVDLGPPGKDDIYGYGLLNPLPRQQVASR